MDGVRIDKWLWAARFFKTRPLAAKACELGRVLYRNQAVKPAREVKVGDTLRVTTPGGDFEIKVEALSDTRGAASIAQTLYSESEESKEQRKKVSEMRRSMSVIEVLPTAKPTGKDRRDLNRFRGRERF